MNDYDLIIAGAGLAGSTAAYVAAKAGLKTLLIERGNKPGAKNMTGGRIYAHSLEEIVPGFAKEAPLERCVTTERLSFLTENAASTLEYAGEENPDPSKRSYTVLRARFDQWLSSKAQAVGAELLTGTRVDRLLWQNGFIYGVEAGKTEYYAPIVLIADGVNSTLAQKAGMAEKAKPGQIAIGVKEVIEFDGRTMRDRFGCIGDHGLAWLFAGAPTDGKIGGGFLYTNKTSISLGIVFTPHGKDKPSVTEMLERFRRHPAIAPLLEGGAVTRYPAHMVPEGGLNMAPALLGNGIMIAGDAAAMCINLGYTVRGMDFAIAAGRYAAEAAIEAHDVCDFGFEQLGSYKDKLAKSFVLQEMQLYRDAPEALGNERVFSAYPRLACDVLGDIFTVDGKARSLFTKFWDHARASGTAGMLRDGIQLLGAL